MKSIMKFSQAISRLRRWFSFVETNVSKTDEDRDGLRNIGLYKTEPPCPADSPAQENFIILTRQESMKLYIKHEEISSYSFM
jgi:hypothetical protein